MSVLLQPVNRLFSSNQNVKNCPSLTQCESDHLYQFDTKQPRVLIFICFCQRHTLALDTMRIFTDLMTPVTGICGHKVWLPQIRSYPTIIEEKHPLVNSVLQVVFFTLKMCSDSSVCSSPSAPPSSPAPSSRLLSAFKTHSPTSIVPRIINLGGYATFCRDHIAANKGIDLEECPSDRADQTIYEKLLCQDVFTVNQIR